MDASAHSSNIFDVCIVHFRVFTIPTPVIPFPGHIGDVWGVATLSASYPIYVVVRYVIKPFTFVAYDRFSSNSKYSVPPKGIFCLITFLPGIVVAE